MPMSQHERVKQEWAQLDDHNKAANSYAYEHYWCNHEVNYCITGDESTYGTQLADGIAQGSPDALWFHDHFLKDEG